VEISVAQRPSAGVEATPMTMTSRYETDVWVGSIGKTALVRLFAHRWPERVLNRIEHVPGNGYQPSKEPIVNWTWFLKAIGTVVR